MELLSYELVCTSKKIITVSGYIWFAKQQIGNYDEQIREALRAANQPTDGDHIERSLFFCSGGPNGEIEYLQFCGNRCVDGGTNHNDYCY